MKRRYTDEERKERARTRSLDFYRNNKQKYDEYRKSQLGRAISLLNRYKSADLESGRGECTLTAKWVVDNIFTKPCAHCGETDWRKIGCNRLDNSKPHTEDNVEPCCWECNKKLGNEYHKKKICQYTKEGVLVKVWDCVSDAINEGYYHVVKCCKGERKTCGGFVWKYKKEGEV